MTQNEDVRLQILGNKGLHHRIYTCPCGKASFEVSEANEKSEAGTFTHLPYISHLLNNCDNFKKIPKFRETFRSIQKDIWEKWEKDGKLRGFQEEWKKKKFKFLLNISDVPKDSKMFTEIQTRLNCSIDASEHVCRPGQEAEDVTAELKVTVKPGIEDQQKKQLMEALNASGVHPIRRNGASEVKHRQGETTMRLKIAYRVEYRETAIGMWNGLVQRQLETIREGKPQEIEKFSFSIEKSKEGFVSFEIKLQFPNSAAYDTFYLELRNDTKKFLNAMVVHDFGFVPSLIEPDFTEMDQEIVLSFSEESDRQVVKKRVTKGLVIRLADQCLVCLNALKGNPKKPPKELELNILNPPNGEQKYKSKLMQKDSFESVEKFLKDKYPGWQFRCTTTRDDDKSDSPSKYLNRRTFSKYVEQSKQNKVVIYARLVRMVAVVWGERSQNVFFDPLTSNSLTRLKEAIKKSFKGTQTDFQLWNKKNSYTTDADLKNITEGTTIFVIPVENLDKKTEKFSRNLGNALFCCAKAAEMKMSEETFSTSLCDIQRITRSKVEKCPFVVAERKDKHIIIAFDNRNILAKWQEENKRQKEEEKKFEKKLGDSRRDRPKKKNALFADNLNHVQGLITFVRSCLHDKKEVLITGHGLAGLHAYNLTFEVLETYKEDFSKGIQSCKRYLQCIVFGVVPSSVTGDLQLLRDTFDCEKIIKVILNKKDSVPALIYYFGSLLHKRRSRAATFAQHLQVILNFCDPASMESAFQYFNEELQSDGPSNGSDYSYIKKDILHPIGDIFLLKEKRDLLKSLEEILILSRNRDSRILTAVPFSTTKGMSSVDSIKSARDRHSLLCYAKILRNNRLIRKDKKSRTISKWDIAADYLKIKSEFQLNIPEDDNENAALQVFMTNGWMVTSIDIQHVVKKPLDRLQYEEKSPDERISEVLIKRYNLYGKPVEMNLSSSQQSTSRMTDDELESPRTSVPQQEEETDEREEQSEISPLETCRIIIDCKNLVQDGIEIELDDKLSSFFRKSKVKPGSEFTFSYSYKTYFNDESHGVQGSMPVQARIAVGRKYVMEKMTNKRVAELDVEEVLRSFVLMAILIGHKAKNIIDTLLDELSEIRNPSVDRFDRILDGARELGYDREKLEKNMMRSYSMASDCTDRDCKDPNKRESVSEFVKNYRDKVSNEGDCSGPQFGDVKQAARRQRELNSIFTEFLERVGQRIRELRKEMFNDVWYVKNKNTWFFTRSLAYLQGFFQSQSLWKTSVSRLRMANLYVEGSQVAQLHLQSYKEMLLLLNHMVLDKKKNVRRPTTDLADMEKHFLRNVRKLMWKAHDTLTPKTKKESHEDMPLCKLLDNVLKVRTATTNWDVDKLKELLQRHTEIPYANVKKTRPKSLTLQTEVIKNHWWEIPFGKSPEPDPVDWFRPNVKHAMKMVKKIHEIRDVLNQANILAIQGPQKTGKSTLVRAILGSRKDLAVNATRNTEVIGIYLLGNSHPVHVADFPGSDHNTRNKIFETAEELRETCESFIKMTIIVLNYQRVGSEEVKIVEHNLKLGVPFLICLNGADQLFGAKMDENFGNREDVENKTLNDLERERKVKEWLGTFNREVEDCHERVIKYHLHGVKISDPQNVWITSFNPRRQELKRRGVEIKMSQLYEANTKVKGIEHVRLWAANELLKVGQVPESIHNLFDGRFQSCSTPSDKEVLPHVKSIVYVKDFKELMSFFVTLKPDMPNPWYSKKKSKGQRDRNPQENMRENTLLNSDVLKEFPKERFEGGGGVLEAISEALFGHPHCQGELALIIRSRLKYEKGRKMHLSSKEKNFLERVLNLPKFAAHGKDGESKQANRGRGVEDQLLMFAAIALTVNANFKIIFHDESSTPKCLKIHADVKGASGQIVTAANKSTTDLNDPSGQIETPANKSTADLNKPSGQIENPAHESIADLNEQSGQIKTPAVTFVETEKGSRCWRLWT